MAGFQPTLYGRIWVTPEGRNAGISPEEQARFKRDTTNFP